jgi:uncharacterized protein (DUF2236 family)
LYRKVTVCQAKVLATMYRKRIVTRTLVDVISRPWVKHLNASVFELLGSAEPGQNGFRLPLNQEALVAANSVSWRILRNPVALFIGGVSAVLLELAEPSVCAGVWQYSSFRTDPVGRLRRTALAAMVTVYGARSVSEPMIARIVKMHDHIRGCTAGGTPFAASDPILLNWVHATATFGFAEAHRRYVSPISNDMVDSFYREAGPVAKLYGVLEPPTSAVEMREVFDRMRDRLSGSPIIFEFLAIMREAAVFPFPVRWLQPIFLKAAVELLPAWVRDRLDLGRSYDLRRAEHRLVRWAGIAANQIVLKANPAVQACLRLGLPSDYLYG